MAFSAINGSCAKMGNSACCDGSNQDAWKDKRVPSVNPLTGNGVWGHKADMSAATGASCLHQVLPPPTSCPPFLPSASPPAAVQVAVYDSWKVSSALKCQFWWQFATRGLGWKPKWLDSSTHICNWNFLWPSKINCRREVKSMFMWSNGRYMKIIWFPQVHAFTIESTLCYVLF